MQVRQFTLLSVICVMFVVVTSTAAHAQWSSLLPFEHVESNANKSYNLTEKNGPWLILAMSFDGPNAQQEAQKLAVELRQRYKLRAYTHKKDYADKDQYEEKGEFKGRLKGRGVNCYGQQNRMVYLNETKKTEYAVLVEDYETIDAAGVAATLKTIKAARPNCLIQRARALEQEARQNHQATRNRLQKSSAAPSMTDFREHQRKEIARLSPRRANIGPMRHAFVTRNPMLPANFFAPKGLDKLVVSMNKGVKHSLLACPGRYSLRIATFRGNVIIDQKQIAEIERGTKMVSRLEQAAIKAHKLTEFLRAKGCPAYEFHDRHESIVTVGNFDTIGNRGPDGRMILAPALVRAIDQFKAQPIRSTAQRQIPGVAPNAVALQPRIIQGIPIDVSPVPVEVPRRSIATDYANPRY